MLNQSVNTFGRMARGTHDRRWPLVFRLILLAGGAGGLAFSCLTPTHTTNGEDAHGAKSTISAWTKKGSSFRSQVNVFKGNRAPLQGPVNWDSSGSPTGLVKRAEIPEPSEAVSGRPSLVPGETTRLANSDVTAYASRYQRKFRNAYQVQSPTRNAEPMLSSITASASSTTATIEWTTDEASNSLVTYGTSADYSSATASSSLTTLHSVKIAGLFAGLTYHFRVQSVDYQGHIRTSGDQTFLTSGVSKNIVTDFGATCNGSGEHDHSAFTAFNAWALNWQRAHPGLIELYIPSGSVCVFNKPSADQGRFAKGIKDLLVYGYGATLSSASSSGDAFWLGGIGVSGINPQDDVHSARVLTVNAGSDSVTLLTPSQTSLFRVGNYALMAGLDTQGYGYPPNPYFYEYVQIQRVSSSSGVITLNAPLKNTYKSTWPLYFSGNRSQPDQGGPATLYTLDPSWDAQIEYAGLTISQDGQTYSPGRSITYRDVSFTGGACGIPTENMSWTAIDANMPNCDMEVDKLIDSLALSRVTIRQILFQSASPNLFVMDSSTVTSTLNGTPKKTMISNSSLAAFRPGAYAYGNSKAVTCTDCVLNSVSPLGVFDEGGSNNIGVNNFYSMAAGIITSANLNGPMRWAVPGAQLFWRGQYENEGVPFTVLDVTQDATNTYVQTSLTGGFPSVPQYHGVLTIAVNPAPEFTCTNCTGSADAVDLSQA